MEPLSKIANIALEKITNGQFPSLPKLAITGLLNDFQYAWLRRLKIPYKFEMLDLARQMCNGENAAVFKATQRKRDQCTKWGHTKWGPYKMGSKLE